MQIEICSTLPSGSTADALVLFFLAGDQPQYPTVLPGWLLEWIDRLQSQQDLPKQAGESRRAIGLAAAECHRVQLICLGTSTADLTTERLFRSFCTAARNWNGQPDRKIVWMLPTAFLPEHLKEQELSLAGTALELAAQSQAVYQKETKRFPYQSVTLVSTGGTTAALEQGRTIGRAINLTRELINRSPHEINPENFAARASQVATQTGLTCTIFDEHQLQAEKMNSLLAVAGGSAFPPRMVALEYQAAGEQPFIGLIGKGVTYDSGGLSIKPTDSMKTMKSDMSGAATVLGVMQAIAELKLPINVRGYMGLVENMISGSSYRVGDVLTARNGVTIEVLNTDAEGRLVLADVLCYAVDAGCEKLIDLATLTGSCVVALGEDYTGVFTNDAPWCEQLLDAGETAGEKLWQMPMDDSFNDQLQSDVADCKNVGTRWGGAITAAKFLEKFVSEKPWIHLDIAGPAFLSDSKPYREGGATGVMVRSLVQLLMSLS